MVSSGFSQSKTVSSWRHHYVQVAVSPSTTSVVPGGQVHFSASVSGTSNQSVTWSASAGVVTSSGVYTAPKTAGTYTVKATSVANSYAYATATVKVTSSSAVSVSITPTSASVSAGGSQSFSATVANASNAAVTWSVSAGAVSGSGNSITYIAPSTAGNYVVTATSVADSTKSASANVTVAAPANVGITITPTAASLSAGSTKQFSATVSGTSNTSVNWSASAGSVSSSGLYTAPSTAGTYTVTATSAADTSKKASATVTVTSAAAVSVSVSPTSASLTTGGSKTFTATVSNASNTSVTWSANGGTVSGSGVYTAPSSPGTYTVTATSVADTTKKASATVTVAAASSVSIAISPTSVSLSPNATKTFTATVSNSSNTGVTWSATAGSISGSGNTITYTAPSAAGTYKLTATSVADTSKQATATVTDTSSTLGGFEGYGANATGGKNVVYVTNLNASGSGSLAAALVSGNWVKFNVSGTINLGSSSLKVPANVTIDGFSSPSGITITSSGTSDCLDVWNSNVIIQGIRVRNCGGDDIQIAGANGAISNIVVDHVETEAGGDGNIDITESAHEVTVSWSILANNSVSGLQLIKYRAYHVSVHHNIYYNSYGNSRVPWCEGGDDAGQSGSTRDFGAICDVRYNIMSKWVIGTLFETDGITKTYGNVVSNYYDGQDSSHARNNISISGNSLVSAYVAGNASVLNPSGCPYGMSTAPKCITKTNDPSNHAEYSVPAISGPTTTDAQGRVDEWTSVLNQAGVITHFPDDSVTTGVRSGITPPKTTTTSQSWNQ